MMKKTAMILAVAGILATSFVVSADTNPFHIIVGGDHPDTKSVRTLKNPYDTDNNFYVTGHEASRWDETIQARSYNLEQPYKYYTIHGTVILPWATQFAVYNVQVPHNEMYYMNTEFTNGIGTVVEMWGNYTP